MKNIYLVLLIIIALAVFILGMAIFINQKMNPQPSQPQAETPQLQTEGTEGSTGGVAGSPIAIPQGSSPATESATQP